MRRARAQSVAASTSNHEGARIPMTVSVGVAPFDPRSREGSVALLAAADAASSAAKRAGRNRVEIAIPVEPAGEPR